MPDHVDDELLVAAMAVGDQRAATAFVQRHAARVNGVAYAIVGDRQAAEDVAQEAFLRAWRAAPGYDARRGSPQAWVTGIVRNAAIDHVRARRPQPFDPALLADLMGAGGDDPHDQAVAADDTRRLRIALASLPPEQRRALVLAGIGGRTAAEVGEAEGIPLGTAKTRIRTGLRRLRLALDDAEVDRAS